MSSFDMALLISAYLRLYFCLHVTSIDIIFFFQGLDFGDRISGTEFRGPDFGDRISGTGFWGLDFRDRISESENRDFFSLGTHLHLFLYFLLSFDVN